MRRVARWQRRCRRPAAARRTVHCAAEWPAAPVTGRAPGRRDRWQLRRNAGGLTQIPTMRQQIGGADLQLLGAAADAQRARIASLQNTWTCNRGLQRSSRCPVRGDWVAAQTVQPPLGWQHTLEQGGEHQIPLDQVVDHIPNGPFGARCRRRPLKGTDFADQIPDCCDGTCAIINRVCHATRLRRSGAAAGSGRVTYPFCRGGRPEPGGERLGEPQVG
jgi:hypothetical protein